MTVKTLSAPTIKAAMAEARSSFGDDVVLLESHPPVNGQPARITVMTDSAEVPSPEAASISRVIERVKQAPRVAYGYTGGSVDLLVEDGSDDTDTLAAHPAERSSDDTRRRLFPPTRSTNVHSSSSARSPSGPNIESLLDDRLGSLHERLNGIERKFEGHPASAGKWQRHPLFTRLLDRGLNPQTVTELFTRVTTADLEDDDALFWALAREIRSMLSPCAGIRTTGSQIFIGPGGSGKTSMILRLARHNGYFGRRRCGVIIVSDFREDTFSHDPTDLYRRHGIPVQNVSTAHEMDVALQRLVGFDQILIDTAALPRNPRAMRDTLARLKPVLAPAVPSQVHLVVDATSALDELDADVVRRMPVPPDTVCLTRMDETSRAGRVAEWLRTTALPVNFVGSGRSLSDGMMSFSPAAFAEMLLEH